MGSVAPCHVTRYLGTGRTSPHLPPKLPGKEKGPASPGLHVIRDRRSLSITSSGGQDQSQSLGLHTGARDPPL